MRWKTSLQLAWFGILCAAAAGCTDPNVWGRTWPCTEDDDCARGWACAREGVCVQRPASPEDAEAADSADDAAGRARRDGPSDAPAGAPDARATDSSDGVPSVLQEDTTVATPDIYREPDVGGVETDTRGDETAGGPDAPDCLDGPGRCDCGRACDDGDRCTEDRCGDDGACQYDVLDCGDGDPCTVDTCDPAEGCVRTPATCDDGDPCTVDTCSAAEGCVHVDADDGTLCAVADAAGRCVAGACCVPACGGRVCGDDGCQGTCGSCTDAEVCAEGACVALPGCGDGTCDEHGGEDCRTCPDDCATEGVAPEECDGIDNDCDGSTDEDLPAGRTCERAVDGVGTCTGREECRGVTGWVCDAPRPTPEDCDGVDDDCDGETDEGLDDVAAAGCRAAGSCAAAVRAPCVTGIWTCDFGAVEGYEPHEVTCDGVDNDCDGQTDEALSEQTSVTACETRGVCAAGVPATCPGGEWVCDYAAVVGHEPIETTCDGRDNDCDGQTDEDACVGVGEPCETSADCAGLPCALDIDGVGRFCAASETHCIVARQAPRAAPIPDGDVYCLGNLAWRRCDAGVWSAASLCDDGVDCTIDSCQSGPGCVHTPDDSFCASVGCGLGTCDPTAGCVDDAPRCDCLSLRFRGHERVVAPSRPEFGGGPGATRTFEAWFRLDALREESWGSPILSKLESQTRGDWALLAIGSDLVFRFFLASGGTSELRATNVLSIGTWIHAAVVVDSSEDSVSLFVDANLVATTRMDSSMATTAAPLRVGPSPAIPLGIYAGGIDEVRIWTVARTAAEIAGDYARPLSGTEPGLAGYWPFHDVLNDYRRYGSYSIDEGGDLARYEIGTFLPTPSPGSPLYGPECCHGYIPSLMISELRFDAYEGGAAVELFNVGQETIRISDFQVETYQNGSTQGSVLPLPDYNIEPYSVVLMCNAEQIYGDCDLLLPLTFDANDSIVLVRAPDGQVVDSFGKVGHDPGERWGGVVLSMETSLVHREFRVDENPYDEFDSAIDWYPMSNLYAVRSHEGICGGLECPDICDYNYVFAGCNDAHYCEYEPYDRSGSTLYGSLIWIPPSMYFMGSPRAGESPAHAVGIGMGYFVDKYEVTADMFASFMNIIGSNECVYNSDIGDCIVAGSSTSVVYWSGTNALVRSGCQSTPGGTEDSSCAEHPVTDVTWYGAGAFCQWVAEQPWDAQSTGRLCTEAEWERAAKGDSDREYAWGDEAPDIMRTNCAETICADGFLSSAPIGRFPAGVSPVGAMDLSGNAQEWVEDDGEGSYADAPLDGTAWRANPRAGTRRQRGGSYTYYSPDVRAAARQQGRPDSKTEWVGFRCCRSWLHGW